MMFYTLVLQKLAINSSFVLHFPIGFVGCRVSAFIGVASCSKQKSTGKTSSALSLAGTILIYIFGEPEKGCTVRTVGITRWLIVDFL